MPVVFLFLKGAAFGPVSGRRYKTLEKTSDSLSDQRQNVVFEGGVTT